MKTKQEIVAVADAAHARFPQYAEHWSGDEWKLVRFRTRVATKRGVAFRKGEITIAKTSSLPAWNPRTEKMEDRPTVTAYSVTHAIDTSVGLGDVTFLDGDGAEETLAYDPKVGDLVIFGEATNKPTLGRVVRVNAKTASIVQLELRKKRGGHYPVGTEWRVGVNGLRPAPAGTEAPSLPPLPPSPTFRPGQKVSFDHKGQTLTGVVVRVNAKTVSLDTGWRVPPGRLQLANGEPPPLPKRPTFRVGQRVAFTARGQEVTGVVMRVSAKTVSIQPDDTESGRYWRVSPGALTAL
jgi:hypothetical protein